MLMLVGMLVSIDMQTDLHTIPAVEIAAVLRLRHEALFDTFKLPPCLETQRQILRLRQRQHGTAQALSCQVRVEALAVHGPGLANTARFEFFAVILMPNIALIFARERLSLRVGVHLHHEDFTLTLESHCITRSHFANFSWAGTSACSEDFGSDLPIRFGVHPNGRVARQSQPIDGSTTIVNVHSFVRRASHVWTEGRKAGAIPKRPISEVLRHQIPRVARALGRIHDALRGKGHTEVQENLTERMIHRVHLQIQWCEGFWAIFAHELEEIVICPPAEGQNVHVEGFVVLQRAAALISQESVLGKVGQEHCMNLIKLPSVGLFALCVDVRGIDAIPIAKAPCIDHRTGSQIEKIPFQPGGTTLHHDTRAVAKTTLNHMGQFMGEGIGNGIRIGIPIHHFRAEVEDDVIVGFGFVVHWPRIVHQKVT
mmetsp:Transcript_76757/g.126593  ORF Transcript_76757/g.126593 Transcript_76757/m.126593 type:complete len:426 (-) Transcript_76757:36-1313(-)